MYTLVGADVAQLSETSATVVLDVLELDHEQFDRVSVTVDLESAAIRTIEAVHFSGPELEGFIRSVHNTTCLRIDRARRGAPP